MSGFDFRMSVEKVSAAVLNEYSAVRKGLHRADIVRVREKDMGTRIDLNLNRLEEIVR